MSLPRPNLCCCTIYGLTWICSTPLLEKIVYLTNKIVWHAKFELLLICCLFLSFQLLEGVQIAQDARSGLQRCLISIQVAATTASEASCCNPSLHTCHLLKSQSTSTRECPPQWYLRHHQQSCLLTVSRVPARSVAYGNSVEIPGVWQMTHVKC